MKVEKSVTLNADIDTVWAIIGDAGRVDWVPSITSSSFDGERRTMKMQGAGEIVEQIFKLDAEAHLIEYGVVESAAPLAKHLASMQLRALAPNQTELQWQTEVEPDAFAEFIEQGMDAGIQGLHRLLASDES